MADAGPRAAAACDAIAVLRERACWVLQCDSTALRVRQTAEGLMELCVMRRFAARGPSNATLVGTYVQLDLWLSRMAAELGDDA